MSERYRLVFRGEVLEGQHPAVVRKRLAQSARFDDAQLDTLFSGKPVVLKRDVDQDTAARLQALFRQAGARLRVLPLSTGSAASAPAGAAATEASAAPPTSAREAEEAPAAVNANTAAAPAWDLLPAGSDLLRDEERQSEAPLEIDLSGLSLAPLEAMRPAATDVPQAPDVSHLSLAEPGTRLGQNGPAPVAPVTAPVFEVAEAGADLSPRRPAPVPPAPDVSHIRLADEG